VGAMRKGWVWGVARRIDIGGFGRGEGAVDS